MLGMGPREGWSRWDLVEALIPEAEMQGFDAELRSLSQGLATYEAAFDHLAELNGVARRQGRPQGARAGLRKRFDRRATVFDTLPPWRTSSCPMAASTRPRVEQISDAIEGSGYNLWWDKALNASRRLCDGDRGADRRRPLRRRRLVGAGAPVALGPRRGQ